MSAIPTPRFLQECKQKWCILALYVLLSTGCGVCLGKLAGDPYWLLMHMAASRCVSIVGVVVCIAPYLVVVFLHSKPWLVCLLCGLRIFLFSAAIFAIYRTFGSAGWLISLLMCFSDLCLIPMVIWLCVRLLTVGVRKRCLALTCTFIVAVGMIYYCLISPFLANLMDTYETMGRYAIHVGLDRCL